MRFQQIFSGKFSGFDKQAENDRCIIKVTHVIKVDRFLETNIAGFRLVILILSKLCEKYHRLPYHTNYQ